MNKLVTALEKNREINDLLESFKEEVIHAYETSNEIEEFIMSNYRDTIFRRWLFSPLVEETYMTPNFIINEIAQNIEAGNYSIIPHIKISFDNNEVTFKTKWIKYSAEESPVLEDLAILVNHCNPTLIEREGNKYTIDNGEMIIEELNFRSGYYIKYLLELATKLNIIEEIRAIGCRCYKLSNSYDKYKSLDNKEKIDNIIKRSIEISNKTLKDACCISNANIATEVLDNGVTRENYNKYMTTIINHYESITESINDEYKNTKELEMIEELGDMLGGNISYMLAESDFGVFFDINFTNIFSYYLGVTNCLYFDMFFVKAFNKITEMMMQKEDSLKALFSLEVGHDLTTFGEESLLNLKKKFRDKIFKKPNDSFKTKELVDFYLETKEEKLEEYLGNLDYSRDFDDIFHEDDDEMLEDIFGKSLPQEMVDHLGEFGGYLMTTRNLKEKTATKHCENTEFYLRFFMDMQTLADINKITIDTINDFIVDWYIPKLATSKSNVKDVITSLSQYLKFLLYKCLINKELLESFKIITNKKEYYLEYFDEYMEDDDDDFMW